MRILLDGSRWNTQLINGQYEQYSQLDAALVRHTCHQGVITNRFRPRGKAAKVLEARRITSKPTVTSARAMDAP